MDFLYFPEDKSEYIPSFIVLVIFMAAAVVTMVFVYKKSKKDAKYFDEKYKDKDFSNEEESSSDKK